jgi:hypothetical protein
VHARDAQVSMCDASINQGVCVMILTLTLCTSVLWAEAILDEPRSMHHYVREHGAGANMDVPRRPLQRSEVERWGHILNASDAQRQFMLIEYERFVERHNAFMDLEAPGYLALGQKLAEVIQTEGVSSPAVVELGREVDQANVRLRNQLIAVENSFIDTIEPILTPEQAERVPLLRHDARRRNCRTFRSFMRWIDIELRDIWTATVAEMASPEYARHVEAILADYEPQLTALICRRADLQFELRAELRANRIARTEGVITFAEANARYQRIMRRRLEADRAVRQLNEATAERIASALPEDLGSAFVVATKQAVFREVYPDRTQVHEFMNRVADDDEIGDDQRFIVSQWRDAYAVEHKRLCDELESLCVEWGERSSEGISGYQIQFLSDALKPLLEERTELSLRYLEKLHELLGPDVLARHADAIPAVFRSILEENEDEQISEVDELTP